MSSLLFFFCVASPQRIFRGGRIRRRLSRALEGVRALAGDVLEAMKEVDLSEFSFLETFQSEDCSDLLTLSLPMSSFYFLHDAPASLPPLVAPGSTEHQFVQRISLPWSHLRSSESFPARRQHERDEPATVAPTPPSHPSAAAKPRPPTPSPPVPPTARQGLEPNGPASVKAPPSPRDGHAAGARLPQVRDSGSASAPSTAKFDTEERGRVFAPDDRSASSSPSASSVPSGSSHLLFAPPTRNISPVQTPELGSGILQPVGTKASLPSTTCSLRALRDGEDSLCSPPKTPLRRLCFSPSPRKKTDSSAWRGQAPEREERSVQAKAEAAKGRRPLDLHALLESHRQAATAAAAVSGKGEIGKARQTAPGASTPVHMRSCLQGREATKAPRRPSHVACGSHEESACCSVTEALPARHNPVLFRHTWGREKHKEPEFTAAGDAGQWTPPLSRNCLRTRADDWASCAQSSVPVPSAASAKARADLTSQLEGHYPRKGSREFPSEIDSKNTERNGFFSEGERPATRTVPPMAVSRQQLLLRRGTTRAERMELAHQKRKRGSLGATRTVSASIVSAAAEGDKRLGIRGSVHEAGINARESEMLTHGPSAQSGSRSPLQRAQREEERIQAIREQVAAARVQIQRLPKTRKAQNAVARWKLFQQLQALVEQEKHLMEGSLGGRKG
uniref:Uncharacterized protein n=1 Tax=Neospora caninum (strain Liverpool) TaxID=572307 RepID=A0A0F7U7Y1_NEOCL|nr:TPA: hypothetical protein BN1204_006476 [Neospora caninum Liverpool]